MTPSKNQPLRILKLLILLIIVVGMVTITVSGAALAQADSDTNDNSSENDRTENNDTILSQISEFIRELVNQSAEESDDATGNNREVSDTGESTAVFNHLRGVESPALRPS